MEFKVVGWTNYNDNNYPARDGSEEVNKAIIQELREKGYCFGGDSHAFHNGCTPILNDGTRVTYSYKEWGALMAEALELKDDAWHGIYYEKGSAAKEWCIDGKDKWGHYNYNKKCVYPQEGINEGLIRSFINNGELASDYWDYYDKKYNEKTVLLDNNDEDLNDDDYMRYIVSFYRSTAGITVKKNEDAGVKADCMGYIFEIDNKRYPNDTPYQIQFFWTDGSQHCISDCGNTLAYLGNKLDFDKKSIKRKINTILYENRCYLDEQKNIMKVNRESFILELMTLYSVIEKFVGLIPKNKR